MTTNNPTLVIIGGAFHTPESYEKLTIALRSCGYKVHVPRLPTCNEARPPNADMTDDTNLVHKYVDSLVSAGRTVVAIGHSYGAQVMTNALCGLGLETRSSQGLKGGVSALVYMIGYALPEGMSTFDKFKEFGNLENVSLVFDMAEDQTIVLRDPITVLGLKGPGIDDAEIEAYVKTLCRWHGKGMMQPLEKAAWREIPVAYIHTTTDAMIPTPEQQSMVETLEKAGRKVTTFAVESGHCPNFVATQGVVDAVNKVVHG
ncbi:alpha/beta-hydrolase [Cryphonectria parasitica EP155]|uniref:Alpha/beta-hydrolase n=1 Tax=Cryphonectria parasitica (strain ATCC 38755 / EP155) TaxID=660469 RepID=A0A9P4Y0J2_CRYP1|nr:alpha/beta-hydrolase [Cryphonectria parasitica EP155]KAF3764321.1 alpha/beta-hydrolase [Cryphonectria parasitica EP155]